MLLKNANESALESAAAHTPGVSLREIRQQGNAFRFRLALAEGENHEMYRKIHPRSGRRVAAVCWHGHYDFFENLFLEHPDARIETMIETYDGIDEFYAKAPGTFYTNVGSQMFPAYAGESCKCDRAAHLYERENTR